jgi:thiamine kinase-like enzyme
MPIVVDDVVHRLWPDRQAVVEPLMGGITNANFKVDLGGGEVVVIRVPGERSAELGIDRACEVAANRLAALEGIAPDVVAHDEATGCIVTRFVAGRPITTEELRREPMLGDVVATLRRVHTVGRVSAVFDHYAVIGRYHDTARRHGVREPFDYGALAAVVDRVAAAHPFHPTVLGHNDLLNANFLYDSAVRILDWEYAAMSDPFFDLANLSVNNELGPAADAPLLGHYFGRVSEPDCATLALTKVVSELREAMWAVVQLAVSKLDVDFAAYASERAARAEALVAALDFDEVLAACAGPERAG